jgi:RimJ/RimL family protein N-acetyltransferase
MIETERLVLRDWRNGDAARFAQVTNTPNVMRWLGGVMPPEAVIELAERHARCRVVHGHCFWIVQRHDDGGDLSGEMLGFCGLKRSDAPGAPFAGEFEVGWRLREDAWGKGYAKEAAIASLAAAFDRFGANEVYAITVIENTASWGLMERMGMRRRAELDFIDSRYEPPLDQTITYSITREAWKESR